MYSIEKEQVARVAVNAGIAVSMLIFLPVSVAFFYFGAGWMFSTGIFLSGFMAMTSLLTKLKLKSWTKLLGRFYGKYFSVVEG